MVRLGKARRGLTWRVHVILNYGKARQVEVESWQGWACLGRACQAHSDASQAHNDASKDHGDVSQAHGDAS